jgi:hypothetical protein
MVALLGIFMPFSIKIELTEFIAQRFPKAHIFYVEVMIVHTKP